MADPAGVDAVAASPRLPELKAIGVLRYGLGATEDERAAAFRALADRHAPRVTVLPIE